MNELPKLTAGLSGTLEYQVNETSTARQLGSGTLGVLATPEMVRLMEVAAVAALADYLPAEWTSVGVTISVEHIAPTPVGLNVRVDATLSEVRGRRLKFQVTACDAVEEIGRGTHERVLVEVENFLARAKHKLE